MTLCKRDSGRYSSDDTHETPPPNTFRANDEVVAITHLDANALGNVLEFLPTSDRVRLVSTCRELSAAGLTSKLETFCRKCASCVSSNEHLCTDAPERKWTPTTWQSILTRHGHALTELHLTGCAELSREVFGSPEVRRVLQNLRVLRIDMCTALDARDLETLLAACEHLCEVHIVNMPLDDAGLSALLTSNRATLRVLDLTGCHLLEGSGLQALSGTHVDTVSLEGCHRLKMSELQGMLESCEGLRSLNLQYCHNVDDRIAHTIAATLPTLEHLNLRYCYKLSDTGVGAMCASLVALKTLDLSQCPRITDAAVCAISTSLPHLEHLKLLSCRQLTPSLTLPSLNLADVRREKHWPAAKARHEAAAAWTYRAALVSEWEQADQVGLFTREFGLQSRPVRQLC